jgi:hypothetical protein
VKLSLFLVSGVLGLLWPRPAQSFPHGPPYDEFMIEKITPPKTAPIDDYIIALSKATDINFIADATNFPADAQVDQYPSSPASLDGINGPEARKWQSNRLNVLIDMTESKRLTQYRWEEKTYLLWSEPDLLSLGRLIVSERERDQAQAIARQTLDRAVMNEEWKKYFQTAHGWDEHAQGVAARVKFTDLPPALRPLVESETRRRIFNLFADEGTLDWFHDDYWNQTYFTLKPSTEGAGNGYSIIALMLNGPVQDTFVARQRDQKITIGRVDALRPRQRR